MKFLKMKLVDEVKQRLKSHGFKCKSLERNKFGDLVAWKELGVPLEVQINESNDTSYFDPFIIFKVKCLKPSEIKPEHIEKAYKSIKKDKINAFFVAFKDSKEVAFKIISKQKIKMEDAKDGYDPTRMGYIG